MILGRQVKFFLNTGKDIVDVFRKGILGKISFNTQFFPESNEVKDAIVIYILKMKNILNEQERDREKEREGEDRQILPDNVPTPMTRTSQMASSVMTGPCMDIPWAMFLWTSS